MVSGMVHVTTKKTKPNTKRERNKIKQNK